ncbi:MAG: TonB family protein [Prevotella sp.]|nr:TonB family protein [Prevotella sp.]
MEQKKSPAADLDRRRPAMLVLGVVVALALVLAALEYNASGTDDDEAALLDEIAEEMEFMPPFEDNDPLPMPEERLTLSDQVVVDEDKSPTKEEEQTDDQTPPPLLVTETEVDPDALDQLVEEEKKKEEEEKEDRPMRVAEQAPLFPGGMMQLMKWLTKNLKYPESARKAKISGKVMVAFMVNTDGSVSDVKLLKSVEPSLDNEALRVVRMMPKWEPGISDGKVSRTLVHLPIVFKF